MDSVSNSAATNIWDYFVVLKEPSEENPVGIATVPEKYQKEVNAYLAEQARKGRQAEMEAARKDTTVKLTNQQITYLAKKYNPRRMTEEEYNAFIREMIEMGVVSSEDACHITDWEGGGNSPYASNVGTLSGTNMNRKFCADEAPYVPSGNQFPMTYDECGGDVLTMYGFQAAFRSYDPDSGTYYRARTERTYGKIYTVLQRMDYKNPECGQTRQASYQKRYETGRLAWDLKNSIRLNPNAVVQV